MKLAMIGLCVLGIVAALSAAMLVNGMRAATAISGASNSDAETSVLYTTRALPAMTVVDGSAVVSKPLPKGASPVGWISNPTEVVGKVLAMPMVTGQPFSSSCFAQGAGFQLAAALPNSRRACGISVSDYGGLGELLYPGSVVDVLVTFKSDANTFNNQRRDAVTMTLLTGIPVLAVGQKTTLSSGRSLDDLEPGKAAGSRRVILLVDTDQAKRLELAMEQGTLSLALRNPLDENKVDQQGIALHQLLGDDFSENPMAQLLSDPKKLQDAMASAMNSLGLSNILQSMGNPPAVSPVRTTGLFSNPTPPAAVSPPPPAAVDPPKPQWETTVMHGATIEVQTFPMPEDKDNGAMRGQP